MSDHAVHHHALPTGGRELDGVALSATLHCLTGCAIGEVAGMVIGTALGFSNLATIVLAVALAFVFGYSLTSLPLLRSGLALSAVVPIAFASDTASIALMELVDNLILQLIPGAMHAGVGDVLFWGALSVALVIAGAFAFPLNRWLIARGKGHAVVHETGIHGGPDVRIVGVIAVAAAIFGTVVVGAEALDEDEPAHGGDVAAVRGLGPRQGGLELRGVSMRGDALRFVVAEGGDPVTDFEVEHEKRMHLIVVSRDTREFHHLHPRMGRDGSWQAPVRLRGRGGYRMYADFKHDGANYTLARDLGKASSGAPWPAVSDRDTTATGYRVSVSEHGGELAFTASRGGRAIEPDPYLGARGHLVALREKDLAYLHVHPHEDELAFAVEPPTHARYRLFVQFKHRGRVHTADFTRELRPAGASHRP